MRKKTGRETETQIGTADHVGSFAGEMGHKLLALAPPDRGDDSPSSSGIHANFRMGDTLPVTCRMVLERGHCDYERRKSFA